MCHLVNISVFKKSIILEKRGLRFYLFIFKSDTPPTLLHTLSFPNTFEGQGYCGWGVIRTGQRLRATPARFFLRCGLNFFKGCRVGRQCFLRDEGGGGWQCFFFLEKHHYPFDLQVGPLLGTQGGSWPLLEKS